jgi:nucleotidyltransferase substrate binding protein (TIGR01987 family)
MLISVIPPARTMTLTEPRLDLTALRNAVASLASGLDVVGDTAWFDAQSPAVQNTLMAGVIQNFEFVYELSVKMIRRQIELESDSPDAIDATGFRDMLRIAGEKALIADVEAWFSYRRLRNVSAHTYDPAKALTVYQDTRVFIDDARSLLARLEARNG